jgi:cytochrome c
MKLRLAFVLILGAAVVAGVDIACGGGESNAVPAQAATPASDATGPVDDAADAADAALTCQPSNVLTPQRPLEVLFVTKETLFHHVDAHAAGDVAVPAYLRARGHHVIVSGDSSYFDGAKLMPFDVVMFFVTSGNVVSEPSQQDALVRFVHAGKGVVGTHTATATDNDWLFMYGLMGATFGGHGSGDAQITPAQMRVVDTKSPLTSFLPDPWERTDEWYFYDRDPVENPKLRFLLLLDESSIEPYRPRYPDVGFYGDAGHPLAWTQDYECARVFYTALGHTGEAYSEESFLHSLAAGVEWAGAPSSANP